MCVNVSVSVSVNVIAKCECKCESEGEVLSVSVTVSVSVRAYWGGGVRPASAFSNTPTSSDAWNTQRYTVTHTKCDFNCACECEDEGDCEV